MKISKIVIVGGHHTPALAVVDALAPKFKVQSSKFKIFWIGHKYSMWRDKNVSAEYQEVTARGIPFYDLKAGKLYKTSHPLKLARLPFGFLQAFFYLLKIRPQLIISFGGYLAPPVVIAGWLLRIPSVTHEQTVEGGWANRLVARFAKIVFLTWERSLRYFPKEKCIVVGNPLRKTIFAKSQISNPRPPCFARRSGQVKSQITRAEGSPTRSDNSNLKTIYVTGGKQGSHAINVAARRALPELLEKYNIIHQCGRSSVFNDYEELKELSSKIYQERSSGHSGQRRRYLLKDYFTEGEIRAVFAAADVVISRAGANIVYELAALGKPVILIPIPWVSHDEQRKNAQILVDAGSAMILEEKDLSAESILLCSDELFANLEKFKEGGRRAQKLVRLDAAEKIAGEVVKLLNG